MTQDDEKYRSTASLNVRSVPGSGSKVLGGNQQNSGTKMFEVSEKYYPRSELLGYRIPK